MLTRGSENNSPAETQSSKNTVRILSGAKRRRVIQKSFQASVHGEMPVQPQLHGIAAPWRPLHGKFGSARDIGKLGGETVIHVLHLVVPKESRTQHDGMRRIAVHFMLDASS